LTLEWPIPGGIFRDTKVKALRWRNFKVTIQRIGSRWNFDIKNKDGGFKFNGLLHGGNLIYVSRAALWRTCNFNIQRATSWRNFVVKIRTVLLG
jgi:hypothetical protein